MINSEKQVVNATRARTTPFRISLVGRERENFEKVPIRIAEIECVDATRVLVPVRQPLRSRRSVLDLVFPQPFIGSIHIAGDNSDVLEPAVVRSGIWRSRA